MIDTKLIDGKERAARLRQELKHSVEELGERVRPGLAVVLVGEDLANSVYVRNKARQTVEIGMRSFEHKLPADTSHTELSDLIHRLNTDDRVHGILVQLPLPKHLDPRDILATIDPAKDVDGFHITNVGKLSIGLEGLVPCTPLGCIVLLKETLGALSGKKTVIIGRSNIGGKPLAHSCSKRIARSSSPIRRAVISKRSVGRATS